MPRPPEPAPSLDAVRAGGKAALARALALIEQAPDSSSTRALLNEAYRAPLAHVIGLTGPPGVGKSTLTSSLIERWRVAGRTVGIIAVDPSSRISGGALLGDRTRLRTNPADAGLFVRSMAARDRLGGVADLTVAAMVVMRALFDIVLIETVGVGQSESDVATIADTVLLCVQPGSGDGLQFMKAGLLELPHIMIVTKTDMGETAARARSDLTAALHLAGPRPDGWTVPLLGVSAQNGEGLGELVEAIGRHHAAISPDLPALRHSQAEGWVAAAVKERWGTVGLRRAGPLAFEPGVSPFEMLIALESRFEP
ncbi:MAG TPA: methylmalonyl Co-A mutase-associated GTPase MeaB [Aliidongia sp.]|nr:methylmalonyl Co-A mutase-associated GTPase MeaB [Aliidongia sp.]